MRRTKESRITDLEHLTCGAHPSAQEISVHLGTVMAIVIWMDKGMGGEDALQDKDTRDHRVGEYGMTKPLHTSRTRESKSVCNAPTQV
jgi:hypothetical protein